MVKQTILLVVRITFGFVLILLGMIGLVVPIVPGWIFLIPGLALVSRPIFTFCRESKIPILRETACRISDWKNQGLPRRFFEKLKNLGKKKEQE